jgi:hypothetical protein
MAPARRGSMALLDVVRMEVAHLDVGAGVA